MMHRLSRPATTALCLAALGLPAPLLAQRLAVQPGADPPAADTADAATPKKKYGLVTREELFEARMRLWGIDNPDPAPRRPTSRTDSLAWEQARRAADRDRGKRVVISIFDRRLWLLEGADTLLTAPVGVGMGVVSIRGERFDFSTPRGRRVVLAKETDPVWIPPDWHYTTAALADGREVARLERGRPVELPDGRTLVVRGEQIGTVGPDGAFEPHPEDRPIVYDNTLYIPPIGTAHRRIPNVLGKYKLNLGDGYLIHGTTDGLSIGFPSTHGCVRVDGPELATLFEKVGAGTPVYIY